MSTCKISIIIPIHNSQSYLKRCIESCIAQTIDSFEVILIDDCSSDDSPKIIAEYVSLYPNTIQAIYLKENMRQGGARNQGILAAKGEYIAFVDSDDWIDPDMCEVLYNAAMGADMSGANMIIESDTSKKISLDYQTSLFDSDLRLQYIQSCGLFWTRIYRKQFIIDNSIFFPPRTIYEDAYFNFLTALYAKDVVKFDGYYYHYVQTPNSSVRSRNAPQLYNRINIANLIWDTCSERDLLHIHYDCIVYKYLYMMSSNVLHTCLGQFDHPDINQLKLIATSIKERIPSFKKTISYRLLDPVYRRYLKLVTFSAHYTVFHYRANIDNIYVICKAIIGKIKKIISCIFGII